MADCARYLNGCGIGARYDGTYPNSTFIGSCPDKTGSAAYFSDDYKTALGKFWEAQTLAYDSEASYGWIQWPWKTEQGTGEGWTYKSGLEYGWIPKPVTNREHPNICGA